VRLPYLVQQQLRAAKREPSGRPDCSEFRMLQELRGCQRNYDMVPTMNCYGLCHALLLRFGLAPRPGNLSTLGVNTYALSIDARGGTRSHLRICVVSNTDTGGAPRGQHGYPSDGRG
jgi:hypothetical protein